MTLINKERAGRLRCGPPHTGEEEGENEVTPHKHYTTLHNTRAETSPLQSDGCVRTLNFDFLGTKPSCRSSFSLWFRWVYFCIQKGPNTKSRPSSHRRFYHLYSGLDWCVTAAEFCHKVALVSHQKLKPAACRAPPTGHLEHLHERWQHRLLDWFIFTVKKVEENRWSKKHQPSKVSNGSTSRTSGSEWTGTAWQRASSVLQQDNTTINNVPKWLTKENKSRGLVYDKIRSKNNQT